MATELAVDKESLLVDLLTRHIRAKVREHLMANVGDIVDAVLAEGLKDFQAIARTSYADQSIQIVITDRRKEERR